jgi:Negative regulator of sigma F
MMGAPTTEERIRELVRDLKPVHRIPRLRSVLGAAVALVVVAAALHAGLGGPGLRPLPEPAARLAYLCVLVGLIGSMSGALVGGLAAAVPGRGRAARAGFWGAGTGLALATAVAAAGIVAQGHGGLAVTWAGSSYCVFRSLVLALGPLLLAGFFIRKTATPHVVAAVAFAVAGAVALGAAAVHGTCASDDPGHWLLGHALPPLAAALVLTLPLALLLRRRG